MAQTAEFDHFIRAQEPVYGEVLRELAEGCKRSHWMWFIFPQLRGLGHSAMAERYALDSIAQAKRYLSHQVLGPRLVQCARLVLAIPNPDPQAIFGYPDWMKFRSSMTLFAQCSHGSEPFSEAIARCFAGTPDEATLRLLSPR